MSALPISSQKSETRISTLTHLEVASPVVGCTGCGHELLNCSDRWMTCPVGIDANLKQQKLALEGILRSIRECLPIWIGLFIVIALAPLRRLTQLFTDYELMERWIQTKGFGLRSQAVLASVFDQFAAHNLSDRVVFITQNSFLSDPSIGIGEWQLSGPINQMGLFG